MCPTNQEGNTFVVKIGIAKWNDFLSKCNNFIGFSVHTCKETPVVLFAVPDGKTKENPTIKIPGKQVSSLIPSIYNPYNLFHKLKIQSTQLNIIV